MLASKGCAVGVEAGRDDAAVVEDEKVSWAQMFSETRERIVAECARCAVHDQHAAGAAFGWRFLRDQVFGQIVVELLNAVLRTFVSWMGFFRHWR